MLNLATLQFKLTISSLYEANILVSPSGTPLLTDFGLSQVIHDAVSPQPPESLAGSMRWMAIELIEANAEGADASFAHWQTKASDIWAFGMTVCVSTFHDWLIR